MDAGRNCESRLELGNSWGVVCPLYMHSVCAISSTGRACVSLPIIIHNIHNTLPFFDVPSKDVRTEGPVSSGRWLWVLIPRLAHC